MGAINLIQIEKKDKTVLYHFRADEDLQSFFSDFPFQIEYPDKIETVPDAVLAVPFVCNVLPIIWLEDAVLHLPELDEDFYCSIPEFKKGYIDMFPDADFKGTIHADRIVNCNRSSSGKTAAFFSGGLDATTTLLRHLDERPDLISIWGSDVEYENCDGWMPINKIIEETASEFQVNHITIHSSFRQFDREDVLERKYHQYLHDGWWHDIKHGIALIGHSAPYVWLHRIKTVYIASSNCPEAGKVICASDPSIDNCVRFCGSKVIHDGYEMSRQDKVDYVVAYQRNNPQRKIRLHVCWESKDGNNCCHCEKCYRTITAILIEEGNPKDFGFDTDISILKRIYRKMALEYTYPGNTPIEWQHIKRKMIQKNSSLIDKTYYNDLKWIATFDFFHPEKNRRRRLYNIMHLTGIRKKLSKLVLYQKTKRRYIDDKGK